MILVVGTTPCHLLRPNYVPITPPPSASMCLPSSLWCCLQGIPPSKNRTSTYPFAAPTNFPKWYYQLKHCQHLRLPKSNTPILDPAKDLLGSDAGQVGVKLGDNNSPAHFKLALNCRRSNRRRTPGGSRRPLAKHKVDVLLTSTIYVASTKRSHQN